MSARATRVDWLVFLLLGFFWGSSYLFIKIGVETLPPFTLIAGRLGIGTLVLGGVLLAAREPLPREPRTWAKLAVLAVINIVLPFSLITWGEQSIDSALASILNATVPLFTIVLAALALQDEPITINRLVGLAVGFGGILVLTSPNLVGGARGSSLAGELALVGSSFAYACGSVYARRNVRGLRPMVPAFAQVSIAFVITSIVALLVDHPFGIAIRPDAAFSVAWLGLFGSGLAYLAFFRLLRDWGSTRTSLVAYLLPVVGILLGFLVLGEAIDARILGGTALVIGGVALVNSRYGSRRLFGRAAPQPVAPVSGGVAAGGAAGVAAGGSSGPARADTAD